MKINRTVASSTLIVAIVLFLISPSRLCAESSVTLSWKTVPQIVQKNNESGLLQLTLTNSSSTAIKNTTLILNCPQNVEVEVRELPISFLTAGGMISFILPYRTNGVDSEEILDTAELYLDEKSLEIALIKN